MNYDDVKKRVKIDLLRLDQELVDMPFLIQAASEISGEVFNDLQKADLELDVARATFANGMRNAAGEGRVPSETRIASEAILDPAVQEAQQKVNDLKYESKLINDLVSSLREKGRLLSKLADLTVAGFISPNSKRAFNNDAEDRVNRR